MALSAPGPAGGLGAAVARLFAAEGAQVVLSDVDERAGMDTALAIGARARFMHHDVRDAQDWRRIIAATVAAHGQLDILVNNAGVIEIDSIETQTAEQWRRVNSVIAGGTIVNVASIASLQGEPYVAAYCAAKGAVEALTRSVAVHCAQMKYGIRCNSIHPGRIETPMTAAIPGQMKQAIRDGLRLPSALGAMNSYTAQPEDIAQAVLYLASDA